MRRRAVEPQHVCSGRTGRQAGYADHPARCGQVKLTLGTRGSGAHLAYSVVVVTCGVLTVQQYDGCVVPFARVPTQQRVLGVVEGVVVCGTLTVQQSGGCVVPFARVPNEQRVLGVVEGVVVCGTLTVQQSGGCVVPFARVPNEQRVLGVVEGVVVCGTLTVQQSGGCVVPFARVPNEQRVLAVVEEVVEVVPLVLVVPPPPEAVQVSVGTLLVPDQVPSKPNTALAPGANVPL
jgi:hypothetical protein